MQNEILSKIEGILKILYSKFSPHFKFFLIILILSVTFFTVWTIIKPNNYTNPKIYGVSQYPKVHPYVPPDATICGSTPVLAVNNDCSMCKDTDGNKYTTVTIPEKPDVYYLGSRLKPGKTYCLPKQAQKTIGSCGTYTGKVVWTSGESGQKWDCQCLYPDLFGGINCLTQKSCQIPDYPEKVYLKTTGLNPQIPAGLNWDPINPSGLNGLLVGTTPYDLTNGLPNYKCACPTGYYSTNENPYVCQKDLCYIGQYEQPNAKFNLNTKKCECTGSLVQSNISGFCFPPEATCKPHPITNKCTFGISIKDLIFKLNNVIYVSRPIGSIDQRPYYGLVDMSDYNGSIPLPTSIADLSTTEVKDSFYAYDIVKWSNLSQQEKDTLVIPTTNAIIELNRGMNSQDVSGVGVPCNSYFYKHPEDKKVTKCSEIEGNDMLNKTGYAFKVLKDKNNDRCEKGEVPGYSQVDITQQESICLCPSSDSIRLGKTSKLCEKCIPTGDEVGINSIAECCSYTARRNPTQNDTRNEDKDDDDYCSKKIYCVVPDTPDYKYWGGGGSCFVKRG